MHFISLLAPALLLQSAISVIMGVKWEVSEYLMQSDRVHDDGCC